MRKKKKVFEKAINFSLREEDFGGLLFMPSTGEIIQLNSAAHNLLKDFNNNHIVETTLKDLSFWQELESRGIIKEVRCNG